MGDKVTIVPRNDIKDAALNAATALAVLQEEIERVHKASVDEYTPYFSVLSAAEALAIAELVGAYNDLHEVVYGYRPLYD